VRAINTNKMPRCAKSSTSSRVAHSSGGGDELFRPIVENLLDYDPFLLLADYQSYIDTQERVSALWRDQQAWTRQSILNTAHMGRFSSDRSIRDYCDRVWKVQPAQH
jgi:glycogen phosphorylase